MANKGHFIDRNTNIPTAGLSTVGLDGEGDVKTCLSISNPEEFAESLVKAKCAQNKEKFPALSVIPSSSIRDLLTSELQKSRFMSFKEKFYEEMYFKKPNVGKVKQTLSKPDPPGAPVSPHAHPLAGGRAQHFFQVHTIQLWSAEDDHE